MRKIILGRGEDCDVYIDDPKGLISRKHAIIKIDLFGNTEITDVSKNGTFINGIRMKPHIPYKIRRKDIVVFANTSKLDWNEIPDRAKWIKIGIMTIFILIVAVIFSILILNDFKTKSSKDEMNVAMPAFENPSPEVQESIGDPNRSAIETPQNPSYTTPSDLTTEPEKVSVKPSRTVYEKKPKHKEETEVGADASQDNSNEDVSDTKEKNPGGD